MIMPSRYLKEVFIALFCRTKVLKQRAVKPRQKRSKLLA